MRHRHPIQAPVAIAVAALLSLIGVVPAPAAPNPAPAGLVRITIKFLQIKPDGQADGGEGAAVRLVAASCPVCVQEDDPHFARQNARETIVELDIPRGRTIEPVFETKAGSFDRAILQTDDLRLETEGTKLRLQLPPIERDAVEAGEFATNITFDGAVVRFEHADAIRRFGAYADRLPATQRRAANNLEFALREAVLELGLGVQARSEQLGVIEIMGFDTNAPHGHTDAPPHIHMHLRWPYNTGSQIGHFYLGADGRLLRNLVGVSGLKAPERTFLPGQGFDTISPKGHILYTQTITRDGRLTLSLPDGRSCAIGARGDDFTTAIHVGCTGHEAVAISAVDDLQSGRIVVHSNTMIEIFRYDTRTGRLTSPSVPPAPEPSDVSPTYQLDVPRALASD